MVRVPPTRSNSRSCSTRSSLACSRGASSPISSRKTVPPSAISSLPFLLRDGAGERAFLVAEQLAFEQIFGQGGAVDGDARLVRAAAGAMDGARHQFLAGPAFAEDQHRDVARRHARDELIDVAHARAVAHHVVLHADLVL